MATISWTPGLSGDWTLASGWGGGVLPGSGDTAVLAGTGSYVVTLFGAQSVGNLILAGQGAEFYDAGALTLSGTLTLSAGTLALAYGALHGGTLALAGGHFQSTGGTLDGTAVQGTLDMSVPQTTLFVRDGMAMSGAGGSGTGSIALTGGYSTLEFLGSQTLSNTVISLGATGTLPGQTGAAQLGVAHDGGAASGATLTLASTVWLQQSGNAGVSGILAVGNTGAAPGPILPDMLVNQGTITAGIAGGTLDVTGTGTFVNQGVISVSNGATLELATSGLVNTGSIVVVHATLALGGNFSAGLLSHLGNLNLAYGTGQVEILGTAGNAGGTLAIGLGTQLGNLLGQVSLAGTLQGGVVTDSGGGFGFTTGTGVLDGVAYQGAINLGLAGAALTLTDGTEVSAPGGAAGSIFDVGAGSALLLRGTEVLDGATITLGNAASAGSTLATTDVFLASAGTTATLGPHTSVVQTGAYASLQANGWSPVPGVGVSDTLINQGSIAAGVAGGQMLVSGYGTFINQGSITVAGGDTLGITVAQFGNSGTLTAGAGGTLLLGQPAGYYGTAPAWTNAGQIVVSGGTLVLAGTLTTAQLGTLTETSGSVQLAGTLSNTGGTLAVGGRAGAISLTSLSLGGTIQGGTIADSLGLLSVGAGGSALLDGVSYLGTLALSQAGATLRVRDGLTLSGTADIVGAASLLDFIGSQTFDHAQVLLGAQGAAAAIDLAHDPNVGGADTLTLGAGLVITQSGALASIGRAGGVAGDAIVNQGTINASVLGGTLSLGGPDFINQGRITIGPGETLAITAAGFTNTGSIVVSSGAVSLSGSMTLAGLGRISLGTGVLSEQGTLNLAGGTLSVGTGTALGRLSLTGTLVGGTIVDSGGGLVALGSATLDGVVYDGTLDLSRPFSQIAVADGLTVNNPAPGHPGTILLTGAEARLLATTPETFNNVAISLGSVSQYYLGQHIPPPELAQDPGVQISFGSGSTTTLYGLAGTLGDSAVGQWSDSIVNAGQIAASALGTLTLGGTFLTNSGTIAASGTGIVTIDNTYFANSGVLAIGAGSAIQIQLLNYYAAPNAGAQVFTNAGTIAITGGIFQELTANGLFPAVPVANLAGADIAGYGLVFAQIANSGTIEARGGNLLLTQAVTGNGTMLIDPGATLELAVPTQPGQIVRFAGTGAPSTGGTLKLDTPSSFTGTLSNFIGGDAIDLPGQILTGVGINSGTLVASTATTNYRFTSTTPLGGALSSGRDVHGGATIVFNPQAPGSGQALLPVSQSAMLFWASPVGDEFQGVSANIAGAHISNWSTTDSIDITDMSPTAASLVAMQTAGLDTLTLSDGTHTASIGLTGTYTTSAFHLASDGHGGTMLTYGHG